MKVSDLKKLLNELPEDMEIVGDDGDISVNVEERTLALDRFQGLKVYSPNEYPKYLEGRGSFSTIAKAERLTQVRLERCLVVTQ